MRVTIVNKHRFESLGGSELQCDYIATELVKRGQTVNYIVPDGTKKKYNNVNYKVQNVPFLVSELVESIIQSRPDIVYWRFNKNLFYQAAKQLKKAGIPIIFAVSHIDDLRPWLFAKGRNIRKKIKFFFVNRFEHRGFKYVDAITVNNSDFLKSIQFKKKEYIPNGMTSEFEPFEWERPFCIWVANIKYHKRPELFIKLAKEFEASGVDFLMVGKIQQESYSWIKEKSDLPSNFYYLGKKKVNQVNGILKKSRLHVHTCIPEGFPNIFIQAWLQGKPTVSLGYDPAGFIVQENLGYYSNENWDLFCEQAGKLIKDKKQAEDIGDRAQVFAKNEFSIEKSVDKLEKLMSEVIESKR